MLETMSSDRGCGFQCVISSSQIAPDVCKQQRFIALPTYAPVWVQSGGHDIRQTSPG